MLCFCMVASMPWGEIREKNHLCDSGLPKHQGNARFCKGWATSANPKISHDGNILPHVKSSKSQMSLSPYRTLHFVDVLGARNRINNSFLRLSPQGIDATIGKQSSCAFWFHEGGSGDPRRFLEFRPEFLDLVFATFSHLDQEFTVFAPWRTQIRA